MKFIIVVGLFLTLISFQNCAQVGLEDNASNVEPLYASGQVQLCLPENYTLENIIIKNLNLVQSKNDLQLDSDIDGISDPEEIALGLNPLDRSSYGNIMDRVCLFLSPDGNCQTQSTQNCSQSRNPFGLTNCDLDPLSLDTTQYYSTAGIDTDNDGISDLLEILSDTQSNVADASEDSDRDLITNLEEIMRGSHPFKSDKEFNATTFNNISSQQISNQDRLYLASGCEQELWNVDIKSIPFAQNLKAFIDSDESANQDPHILSFTRTEKSNIVLVTLKLSSKVGQNLPSQFYFKSVLVNQNQTSLDLNMSQFILAGEEKP